MNHPASLVTVLILSASVLSAQTAEQPKSDAKASTALTWGPAPPVFPKGAQLAVVSGDPGKAGEFVIQLSMPDGYTLAPHFHPADELVQVKKGTFLVGMGDKFDAAQLKAITAGASGNMPAKMHHYAQTKGATVISVTAQGPFGMTYINPADDPQTAAKK